jgi:hypothetical protein
VFGVLSLTVQIYRISLSPAAVPIERYISYFIHYLPLPPPGRNHISHPHGPAANFTGHVFLPHALPSSSSRTSFKCLCHPDPLMCVWVVVLGVHAIHLRLDLGLHDPIVDLPTSLEPIEFRLPGTQPTHDAAERLITCVQAEEL